MPIHHDMLGALPTTTERVFRPIANERLGATACSAYVAGGASRRRG